MPTTSARRQIRIPVNADAPDIPLVLSRMSTDIDNFVPHGSGTLASRPSAFSTPGNSIGCEGSLYYATDTAQLFISAGSAWVGLDTDYGSTRRGYAQVLTDESTTSTSFVSLATNGPLVQVNVPTNGIVSVLAYAELKISSSSFTAEVDLLEDGVTLTSSRLLDYSTAGGFIGLYSNPGGSSIDVAQRYAARWLSFPASAGAHTYELRYRSSSASATANFQNRKLWVKAESF